MQLITTSIADHKVLRTPAQPIVFPLSEEVREIIKKMRTFIENLPSPFGKPAGLAAPQLGFPLQIIFLQITPEARQIRRDVFDIIPLTVFINPSYQPIESSGLTKDWEGCYSVADKMGEVYRFTQIQYQAYNEAGQRLNGTARGLLARIIQHEVGHLNGELFVDLLKNDCRHGPMDEMLKIRQQEMESSK